MTGNIPGKAESIKLTWLLGSAPNLVDEPEKSLDLDKNGLIIIDNVLWHGEVADEKNNDKFTINIREFNKFVSKDKRVEQIIIPLGDGMTVCRVL